MNGFRRLSGCLALTLCIFLTGCGTNMAELTAEEEEIIVAYTSGVIAKANKAQTQGLTYLYEDEEEVPEEDTEEDTEPETADSEDAADVNTDENSNSAEAGSGATGTEATLTEVLNMASVTAEYQGYQISNSYVEGEYFALNAPAGSTYLILNINLTNMSQQPVECNILQKDLGCSILINGEQRVDAMPTILLNDFATYMENIEAASVVDTVLIFEVSEDVAANIQTLDMNIEADSTLYYIGLH